MKQLSFTTSRLAILLGAAAIIAVLPVRGEWRGALPTLSGIEAMAKGGDNSGSGSGGGSGGSSSGDDSGGSGSDHGGSDDGSSHDSSDDNGSGSDDGPMHDLNDDNSRKGGAAGAPSGNAGGVVKFEAFGTSIEVVYANGTKEEISAGRYERKNAAGRTVEERAATAADRARLMALR